MRIAEFLKVEAVTPALGATSKSDVLRELASALSRAWPQVPEARFLHVLEERDAPAAGARGHIVLVAVDQSHLEIDGC